jgi:hypothetical protein
MVDRIVSQFSKGPDRGSGFAALGTQRNCRLSSQGRQGRENRPPEAKNFAGLR